MSKRIGILTSGGDSPGINAAIRAIGKTANGEFGMEVIGFQDGFIGLVNNNWVKFESNMFSGILTAGGTILGTSRDLPNAILTEDQTSDQTEQAIRVYKQHNLDALVCLGGNETQAAVLSLYQRGMNIITLPKTIDNDIPRTDTTIGFDSALTIATEAIDRLHSTAHSHHRIIIIEIMGRDSGWLTLGAGISGGADVILIPEIPYDVNCIADAIIKRNLKGKRFSIIAVSEGAIAKEDVEFLQSSIRAKERALDEKTVNGIDPYLISLRDKLRGKTLHLAKQLEEMTRLEARVTILGYLLRGGAPSATDRLLATELGSASVRLIQDGIFGVMVAKSNKDVIPVPLETIGRDHKTIPSDHSWLISARRVGTCLGDA